MGKELISNIYCVKYLFYLSVSFLIVMIITGCAVSGDSKSPVPLHGNFCGPNYPALKSTSAADELRQLAAIQPFDTIDWACKEHDMCYTRGGYFARDCDEKLIIRMGLISNAVSGRACVALAGTIIQAVGASYFAASMNHTATNLDMIKNGNLWQKFGGVLLFGPAIAVDGLSSFQDGMNSLPGLSGYSTSGHEISADDAHAGAIASLKTPCNAPSLPLIQNGVLLGDNCVLMLGGKSAELDKPVMCFTKGSDRVAVPGGKTHFDTLMQH